MLGGKGLIMGHVMALAKLLHCDLKQQSQGMSQDVTRCHYCDEQ